MDGNLDFERPTFFELVAQEQLNDLLGPVLRYITSVYAQRYPRYLLKILNNHDEIFSVLMFFIERYYLKNWGASFSEHFYQLRRQRSQNFKPVKIPNQTSSTSPDRLTNREIRSSLFFLVALPYIKSKAIEFNERLGVGVGVGGGDGSNLLEDDFDPGIRPLNFDPQSDGSLLGKIKSRFIKLFRLIFPYVNAIDELLKLVYGIRYLFDKTPYWRPTLALIGIELRRTTAVHQNRMKNEQISREIRPLSRDPSTGRRPGLIKITLRVLRLMIDRSFESLKIVLPCSIFFFKFLEWWYSSSNTTRYRRLVDRSDRDQFELIRPPLPLKPRPEGVLGSKEDKQTIEPIPRGSCPICKKALVNSTALPSGWVFCYRCAHGYVSEFKRCPVTFYPTTLADLRKIIG